MSSSKFTSDKKTGDEETPLVASQQDDQTESPSGDSGVTDESDGSRQLWEESEHPWPSTFERSIGLLASPVITPSLADHMTKSPKPGATPLGAIRARRKFDAQTKYGTNDQSKLLKPKRNDSHDFEMGIERTQSLDLKKPSKNVDAKAYRQQILKQKKQTQKAGSKPHHTKGEVSMATLSPGYHRELASDKMKQEQAQLDLEGKATFSESLFNMANILMGVGLLGLPYVFKSAGWYGGCAVIVFFAFVTWKTSILIGRELNGDPRPSAFFDDSPYKSPTVPGSNPNARMRRPIKSFPDIARDAFGEWGCFVLSAVLYFELFSCLSIFFVSLGDHLSTLFPTVSMNTHMIIVAFALTVPTAVLRTPKLLSYLSTVGTIATISVVLAVFCSAVIEGDATETLAQQKGDTTGGPYRQTWNTSGLPLALGLIAYCFSGHAIVPSIYSSMKEPQHFERMIDITFLIVIGSSFLVAVSGYWMFGNFVEDQVTLSLEEHASQTGQGDLAMKMLTWLMIMTAFSKFTLTMFPLALGMEEIIAPYIPSENVMEVASSLIKLVLIVASLMVAIFVPSFSFLCSLVGMICTMVVSCIFPAAAHLKLFGPKLGFGEKLIDWIFIIFGSFTAVVGTIATVGM